MSLDRQYDIIPWELNAQKGVYSYTRTTLLMHFHQVNRQPKGPKHPIGGETNFILSEIYTCTYRRQTPELKVNKYKTWAWQGQKLHNMK